MADEASPSHGPPDRVRILCVDDSPTDLVLLEEGLHEQREAYVLATETDPVDALARAESEAFDCVVSDHQMPGLTGVEFCAALRESHPDLPFILFTGSGSEDVASDAISAGATDYLQKSSGLEQFVLLANRIDAYVGQYWAEQTREREQHAQRREFELLVDSVEEYAIFFLDEDGYIETWNAGAERLKGYTESEAVGEHLSLLYPEEAVADGAPQRHLARAAREGSNRAEGWRVRKDGSMFYANATITAIRDGGELVGFVKVTRDMSRERYFREVVRQNERMERFAKFLSHDLKNMVRVARTRLDWARRDGKDAEAQLDQVETTLDRMNELIEPFSTLARQGAFVDDPGPVDVAAAARRAWEAVSTGEASLHVEDGTGEILADGQRVEQLFENLFRNSVEHGPTSSRTESDGAVDHGGPGVAVRVGPRADGFYVADDGRGFDEAERAHAFELGYTTSEEGTGFGLAIVKEIAEAHGWEVELSESAGGGARFDVTGVDTPAEAHVPR